MTPKQTAEELVLKYLRIDNNTKEWFNKHIAKQCSLIAIDEIIEEVLRIEDNEGHYIDSKYWQQVKQEICDL
jgi:hypothetical protein